MIPRIRLQRIIDESRQFIIDAQSWNDNRPDEKPIDCEPERVVLSLAESIAKQWDAGEEVSRETLSRLYTLAVTDGDE